MNHNCSLLAIRSSNRTIDLLSNSSLDKVGYIETD